MKRFTGYDDDYTLKVAASPNSTTDRPLTRFTWYGQTEEWLDLETHQIGELGAYLTKLYEQQVRDRR